MWDLFSLHSKWILLPTFAVYLTAGVYISIFWSNNVKSSLGILLFIIIIINYSDDWLWYSFGCSFKEKCVPVGVISHVQNTCAVEWYM